MLDVDKVTKGYLQKIDLAKLSVNNDLELSYFSLSYFEGKIIISLSPVDRYRYYALQYLGMSPTHDGLGITVLPSIATLQISSGVL